MFCDVFEVVAKKEKCECGWEKYGRLCKDVTNQGMTCLVVFRIANFAVLTH